MRILYVIGRIGVGGDTVVVNNVLNKLKKNQLINDWKIDFLTHEIGYNIKAVEDLKSKGHNVFILKGDFRKLGPKKYYKELYNLLKNRNCYDVIHIHTGLQSAIPILVAKRLKIKKIICHAHSNSIQRKVSFLKNKCISPFLRLIINIFATNKVACSREAGDFLFGKNKYEIINNGIDVDLYSNIDEKCIMNLKDKFDINNENILIGQIGRFSKMKNHEFSLQLARATKNNKKIKYIFVGDGENFEYILDIINKENLNVTCVGRQNNIPIWLNVFDKMILPSLSGEGFPMVLIEAQATMTECLVSDLVPRSADLKINKVKFHSLNDFDFWIRNIVDTKKSENINNKYGIDCIIKNEMSIDNVIKKWIELYEK